MHFVLIHAPGRIIDTGRTQNVGYDFEEVVAALARLDTRGHTHEVTDGMTLTDERRTALESDARLAFVMSPNKKKGRRLGNSFGTNSQPFQDFGTDIPVLLAYEDGDCVDAYPHHEGDRLVTVMEYLTRVPV
jgi:hypothetical protein